jgi:nucleoid DNA-binding protein
LSKKKLIKQLKEKNSPLNQSEIETVINTFSQNITETLKKRNSVEIRGFGRFYTKKLKENFNARNPATNKLIYKPERVKVRFRPAKKLKQIVNK